jgi:hypothetical protein
VTFGSEYRSHWHHCVELSLVLRSTTLALRDSARNSYTSASAVRKCVPTKPLAPDTATNGLWILPDSAMIQTASTYSFKIPHATTGSNTSVPVVDLLTTLTEVLFFLAMLHNTVNTFKYANTSRSIRPSERHNLPRVRCPRSARQCLIDLKHGAGDQSHAASHAPCRIYRACSCNAGRAACCRTMLGAHAISADAAALTRPGAILPYS